jgi:hypothetical protein
MDKENGNWKRSTKGNIRENIRSKKDNENGRNEGYITGLKKKKKNFRTT